MRLARRIGVKLAAGLVMIWLVASGTFFLVRLMPGNPVTVAYENDLMHGMNPNQARAATSLLYGFVPRQPLPAQYGNYLWQLAHLNLGRSISYEGVPVAHIVAAAAPWTVIMVLSGILVSFLIGVSAGVLAAIRRSTRLGDLLSISGSLLHGIPQFVIAILLAYAFTTIWAIFPFGAPYDVTINPGWNLPFIWSLITHAFLPVAAYALSSYGGWLLTMKSSVISVLGDDFILAAELRGLRPLTIARYIARNAMLPLFTILALSIGFMFGGSIFIEEIYDYPGLGYALLSSIGKRDYPLMTGTFLIITVAVIATNILADLLYGVIDPRVRRR
ncbi:MAG: ABC transporter permease [Streptosporangiaceae bacterium]